MKRITIFSFLIAGFLVTSTLVTVAAVVSDGPPAGKLVRGQAYSPEHLLVKFRSGAKAAQIQSILADQGAVSVQSFRRPAKLSAGPIDQ